MSFQKFFYVLSLDGVLGVIFKYEVQHCTSNQPVKPTLDSSLSLDI